MGKVVKTLALVGLAVAVAVFAPQLAPGLLAALGTAIPTALATTVATAAITAALTIAGTLAINAVFPPPSAKSASVAMTRAAIGNSSIIYGKRRASGRIVFFHPRKVGKTHYRYFVLEVAGHRCKGVTRWFLNDQQVSVGGDGKVLSGPYANRAWLWFARGTADQQANATFVGECGGKWTTAHRGRGVAAIYAKFEMTDEVVQAGMPLISAEIEGKDDIRDPRTGALGYTNLAVPVFYDWLQLSREEGGFGAAADEVPDDDLLSAWTNVCDEDVALPGGGSEKRYCFDSLIVTGAAPSEVRSTFVTCCAGTFTDAGGVFKMRPGYWEPVSATLSEDDLAGPITVPALLGADQVAQSVTGTFVDPDILYQPQPVPTRGPGGDDRQVDVDLAHVTSIWRAQRILEIMYRRAQCERRVAWPMNIAGLAIETMDTVALGTARYGLSNYAFAADGWSLDEAFNVALQLREENVDIYSDAITYVGAEAPPEIDRGEVIGEAAIENLQGAVGDQQAIIDAQAGLIAQQVEQLEAVRLRLDNANIP